MIENSRLTSTIDSIREIACSDDPLKTSIVEMLGCDDESKRPTKSLLQTISEDGEASALTLQGQLDRAAQNVSITAHSFFDSPLQNSHNYSLPVYTG